MWGWGLRSSFGASALWIKLAHLGLAKHHILASCALIALFREGGSKGRGEGAGSPHPLPPASLSLGVDGEGL